MSEYKLLNRIENPSDIKQLSREELEILAEELRRFIIEVVSVRGGHLASSLGAVEITLALHYIFDSPRDKILWDVGHQSYAHKIITGRREQFRFLRTRGGISGFPNIHENEHDMFGAGHACTSISAALGFAVARDLRNEENFVIAVVGDGSISGGMALEGINHAGHLKKNRFVIILNDNEMSISKNVGAIARYLTRITTKKPYLQFEADVWELLGRIPSLGGKARKLARRIKESIKNLVVPTILFEELGFRYLGPLDGHDMDQMIDTFSQLHQVPGPVLVHVVTKKGKGYSFAEENAEKFHGIGSFYKENGSSKSVSALEKYSEVFGSAMCDIAGEDESVIAITAAMKEGTGLSRFAGEFPDRFFDVGISEEHAVTFAAGMARQGFKPFVAIYSTFLQRGFDQIIHDVALQRLPVRFILDRAGIVGEDGPTHHGTFDLSYLNIVPGMVVMAPSGGDELRGMLRTMLMIEDGPCAMRFPRGSIPAALEEKGAVPVTRGRGVLLRKGSDAGLIAIGSMVQPAFEAARMLESDGIEVALVDARFAKPIDGELIGEVAKECRLVFTVEENVLRGGFGDTVSDHIYSRGIDARVVKIGLSDKFVPHGNRAVLLEEEGLGPEAIASIIKREVLSGNENDHGGSR